MGADSNVRNTGIAIIISIAISVLCPIAILLAADYNGWFGIILPICQIVLGMILLFIAYVKLSRADSKRGKGWFINKGTILIFGVSLVNTGIVMFVVESIWYSAFGAFLALAWIFLL